MTTWRLGLPFERGSSSAYAPLTAAELAQTLHEIRFKSKSSALAQIADAFLWPLVLAAYGESNRACLALREDFGSIVATFCSEYSSYVTAQSLVVDGGFENSTF